MLLNIKTPTPEPLLRNGSVPFKLQKYGNDGGVRPIFYLLERMPNALYEENIKTSCNRQPVGEYFCMRTHKPSCMNNEIF